jgi:hypothetical protein
MLKTGVMPMYPNKQNKNQKLKKVQGLYRKKRREQKIEVKEYRVGTFVSIIVTICLFCSSFFLL